MQKTSRAIVFVTVAVLATGISWAGDFDLSFDLQIDQFEQLVDHVAEAVDMPSAPAKPLGPTGFSLEVGGLWVEADDAADWWQNSISGSSDALDGTVGYRAALRKGLPRGIDVGLQVGSAFGADFYSAELRAPVLRGKLGRPAVGARVVWSQLAEGPLDLELMTAQITVSKSLKVVAPYVCAGMRWIRADASMSVDDLNLSLKVDKSVFAASAGLRLNIMPLAVMVELRHATSTALFAGVGFGF